MKPSSLLLACSSCDRTAQEPEDRDYTPLWRAGWRWVGRGLASCPDCPPLVRTDEQGRHRRGPGMLLRLAREKEAVATLEPGGDREGEAPEATP